jgi:CDP-glycerol glycerophosphotransferase
MTTGCPGPLLKTNEEVLDALENIDTVEEAYKDKYKEFTDKFCYLDDGHASERIVKKIFGV